MMNQRGPSVVLVVVDDDDSRGLFVAALTLAGFRCLAAAAPDEAIRLATTIYCDVIVMDLGLPRLADGLGLAWRLGALPDTAPLIGMSGHRLASMPSSFRALMMKPVDPDDLVDTVQRVIAEARRQPPLT